MQNNRKAVLNNSIWSIIQQFFILLSSFIIGIISTRFLGTERSGIISVANSLIIIISSISWLGIDSVIVNEIIKDKKNEFKIVWTTLITKMMMSIILLTIFVFLAIMVYKNDTTLLCVLTIVGIGAVFQCYETIIFWFQSKILIKYVAISSIIIQLLLLFYQIYILYEKKNIYWFASVSLIQNILLFIVLVIIFCLYTKSKPCFDFSKLKEILKSSYHYIISSLAITLYMHIDKVMIGKMVSNSEAGIYNVAVNIAVVWQFVPLAIINSLRPIILEMKKNEDENYLEVFKALNFIITIISFVFCLLIDVFAKYGILFLYGDKFIDSTIPLRITVWATMVSMQGVVRGIWFVAEKLYKYDKIFTILAAVVNILLNIVFIRYLGIAGAAIATLISYVFEVFIISYVFKDTRIFISIFLSSFKNWKNNIAILKKYFISLK